MPDRPAQHTLEQIDRLSKWHTDLNEKSLSQLDIQSQLASIDQWECAMNASIHRHTIYVKEKLNTMFRFYTSELKDFHTRLGKELAEKRTLTTFVDRDQIELTRRMDRLQREIQQVKHVFDEISQRELNQIISRCRPQTENIGNWNYLREIPLDSTYGYMAANNSQIFLGWNNRMVIYNLDGMKLDETRLQSMETCGKLCDIIWSTAMQRFFILCGKSVFVHHAITHRVEIVSNLSLFSQENEYRSITTHQDYLILLHEKSLDIWKLTAEGFVLHYAILLSSLLADPSTESICCIRSNDKHLAVLIQNREHQTWRLDLFDLIPIRCIRKGLPFDRFQELNLGLLTALRENTYLFMNWESKTMRRIDMNGNNQLIEFDAYNACLLGNRPVLIVNYMKHLKLFQL